MERQSGNSREKGKGFRPGVDNDKIVEQLVAITEQGENHAKVKRKKDGSLSISAVSEKMIS